MSCSFVINTESAPRKGTFRALKAAELFGCERRSVRLVVERDACQFGGQDGQGSWAQYVVVSVFSCIPVSSKLPVETAGTLIVNPMTAMGLIKKARKHGAKAIVINAAGSSLGRLIISLARRQGIEVLGIVRRPEAAEPLRRLGAHVLVSSTDDFLEKFRELVNQSLRLFCLTPLLVNSRVIYWERCRTVSLAIVYGQISQQGEIGCISFVGRFCLSTEKNRWLLVKHGAAWHQRGSLLLCYEPGQSPSFTNKVLSRWDLSTQFRSRTWLDSRKRELETTSRLHSAVNHG